MDVYAPVTKLVNRLVIAGSLSVCRGILILIMNLPGVSTACTLFFRIFQLVEDTLGLASDKVLEAASNNKSHHQREMENYMDDPSCTFVCFLDGISSMQKPVTDS